MSSVVSGDGDSLFTAIKEVFAEVSRQGEVVMAVTLSNACPVADPQE